MSVLGKRYAEGLARVAREQDHLRDFLRELKQIRIVFDDNPEIMTFMRDPGVALERKKQMMHELFESSTYPAVISFLDVLLDAGRIRYFNEVVDEYRYIANHKEKVFHVEIYTPYELTQDEYDRITEQERLRIGANEMRTEVIIDPSIRGGIVVRVGDFKYDYSLNGAIEDLREYLKQ